MADLASRLNERITIQQSFQTADGAGGFTVAWQDVATVWAEMRSKRAGENYFNSKLTNMNFYGFLVRYRAGLNTKMRIRKDDRYFSITSIVNINEKSEAMEIFAEEIL